jgi:phage tail tape-measure protein
MSASSSIGSMRSSEQASSIGQEVGSVVVVVTIALGLLSLGAAAS